MTPAAAASPSSSTSMPARNKLTNAESPPLGPPLDAIAITTRTEPMNQVQKPAAASRGNVSDRAPTCSGTTASEMPSNNGINTMKVRPTRYTENSCGIESTSSIAACASMRSMPSSTATTITPRRPTRETPMNERPMRLWSVVVNHPPTDDVRARELARPQLRQVRASRWWSWAADSFRFGRAERAPDSVLDRSQTVGYTCEITHRSARGRKSSDGRTRRGCRSSSRRTTR